MIVVPPRDEWLLLLGDAVVFAGFVVLLLPFVLLSRVVAGLGQVFR